MNDLIVGVDVGGTFTDLVMLSDQGSYLDFKSPTTPANPSVGVLDVLKKAAGHQKLSLESFLSSTRIFVHGTTVATNAMVQAKGAIVGLITTKGFRDVLEIRCGRIGTAQAAMWDIHARPPEPIVPRYLRIGVDERIDKRGQIVSALDIQEVEEALRLFRKEGVQSIAVSLLFSFLNPIHELKILDIIRNFDDSWAVSLSSEISPTIKEYERTSSTVVNAFVQPLVGKYLSDLEKELKDYKYKSSIMVTQSNGGLMDVAHASKMSINTLLSGPAAGVTGATFCGQVTGAPNLVLVDMGGTSFDVSLVKGGKPLLHDFTAIGGHYIQTPSIDIHTIGTGGGSIAHVDQGGVLHVGPNSAGATPGPACYNSGGKQPTVTDAYVALGMIDPDYFLGGEMPLIKDMAIEAIQREIGGPLGLTPQVAAEGVVRVSNQQMADAIRRISFEKGEDIRDYSLIAAGGAGPVCAALIAQDLGIRRTLIPKLASAFCAMGMLVADLRHDLIRSHIGKLTELVIEDVNTIFLDLERSAESILEEEGIHQDAMILRRSMDLRYSLQIFEIETPLVEPILGMEQIKKLGQEFNLRHTELYGFEKSIEEIEVVNLRVVAVGKIGKEISETAFGRRQSAVIEESVEPDSVRSVYFPTIGLVPETPVYRGSRLSIGFQALGPAIVEEASTTMIAYPGQTICLDDWGNYVIQDHEES